MRVTKTLATIPLLIVLTFFGLSKANGDIVSSSFSATTSAAIDGTLDSDSSIMASATLQSYASLNNSFTQADLSWAFDGTELTATSLLTDEKTVSARPGGDHVGNSDLVFEFTIDSIMDYSASGAWGFDSATAGGDGLSITLEGIGGPIASDTTTSGTGITSDSFAFNGSIGPGTYTLTISNMLTETINNQGTRLSGWELTSFTLTNTTVVPEAGGWFLLPLVLMGISIRQSRQV